MLKKKKGVTSRVVYNTDYYKAKTMLLDPWFIEKIAWLKKRFKEVGCPLPPRGFKKYKQYLKWRDKYWEKRIEIAKSKEFISKKKEMAGKDGKMSREEFDRLEAFEKDYLPPLYGAVIGEILEHHKIQRDNGKFRDFVEWYIFLNRKDFLSPIMRVNMTRDPKTGEKKMFVQIFEYTKKEDLVNNWDFIADMQKHLPGYIGKSKQWESFDRDFEVYSLYKKLREEKENDNNFTFNLDTEIYVQLHHKYKELTVNNIRDIISRTAKRLSESMLK